MSLYEVDYTVEPIFWDFCTISVNIVIAISLSKEFPRLREWRAKMIRQCVF